MYGLHVLHDGLLPLTMKGGPACPRRAFRLSGMRGTRLTKIDEEDELIFTFVHCQQCEDPICSIVCPVAAIGRDNDNGRTDASTGLNASAVERVS